MVLEAHERETATPAGTGGESSHTLNGIWNKPIPAPDATSNTSPVESTAAPAIVSKPNATDTADPGRPNDSGINEASVPVFTDSDGKPLTDAKLTGLKFSTGSMSDKPAIELAVMNLPKFSTEENRDVTEVADKPKGKQKPTKEDLSRVAHEAVGSNEYGNKVPSNATQFANMDVPQNLKCASTSSEWLIDIGMMTNKDYKIRVADMIKLLPEKGFKQVPLSGDLDLSKFPDGPIGFITGRGNYEDGSSHIGFIEKRNGELRVIHNNYETGKVVDQNIKEKFYSEAGKPAYRHMNMFVFPKR